MPSFLSFLGCDWGRLWVLSHHLPPALGGVARSLLPGLASWEWECLPASHAGLEAGTVEPCAPSLQPPGVRSDLPARGWLGIRLQRA